MPAASRLLPGESRGGASRALDESASPAASSGVMAAPPRRKPPRSVNSIRAQFEGVPKSSSASALLTPATSSPSLFAQPASPAADAAPVAPVPAVAAKAAGNQRELARYLSEVGAKGAPGAPGPNAHKLVRKAPATSEGGDGGDVDAGSNLLSMIERFGGGPATAPGGFLRERVPLVEVGQGERGVLVNAPETYEEPDTFCEPAGVMAERFAAAKAHEARHHPMTDPGLFGGEERMRNNHYSPQRVMAQAANAPATEELLSAKDVVARGEIVEEVQVAPQAESGQDDWGASANAHLQELFIEAETTAERAVQCDENEDYYDAFSLYCNVVELYYKVIPFLNVEEGDDVNQRIQMYTRRCDAIKEAFDNDELGDDGEVPFEVEIETPYVDENIDDEAERTARNLLDLEEFGAPCAAPAPPPLKQQQQGKPPQPRAPVADVPLGKADSGNSVSFPDAAPRAQPQFGLSSGLGTTSAATAAAHRNRLSRPISRRSIMTGTSSVSREKVAEMQERVQVMQACLNNFTVKRKHLGPARALELQITTLNANTFGDLKCLAPLSRKHEHMWSTELEVLLSMLGEIKEARPGGPNVLREDIKTHLPALQRCDRILRNTVRSFSGLAGHVEYVDRETDGGPGGSGSGRERWWVKVPVVKKGGMPAQLRQPMDEVEKEMRGVFKICHEINVEVVKSMPVPDSFVNQLPRHARSLISKDLKDGLTTWGMFKVSDFMKDRGMWNREAAKDLTSSLEKVALIWEAKATGQSFISRTFDIRGDRFNQALTAFRRCQNAIRDLRREWPTMTHTDLDMAKIQDNEDIGFAGLEAYSRALESRAARLLTRLKELLDADDEMRGIGRKKSPVAARSIMESPSSSRLGTGSGTANVSLGPRRPGRTVGQRPQQRPLPHAHTRH